MTRGLSGSPSGARPAISGSHQPGTGATLPGNPPMDGGHLARPAGDPRTQRPPAIRRPRLFFPMCPHMANGRRLSVLGVLIEMPAMLSVVLIANRSTSL